MTGGSGDCGDVELSNYRGPSLFEVGARLGYAQQLGQESWVRDDALLPDLRGGPSLDVSGPYARLLLGIYGEL